MAAMIAAHASTPSRGETQLGHGKQWSLLCSTSLQLAHTREAADARVSLFLNSGFGHWLK